MDINSLSALRAIQGALQFEIGFIHIFSKALDDTQS